MANREAVQRAHGTTEEHETFIGVSAEITVDTEKNAVVVHDGETPGGFPMAREDLSNVPLADLRQATGVERDGLPASLMGVDGIFHMRTAPAAVQSDGITFFGWVTRGGDVTVASYDKTTGEIKSTVIFQTGTADDHDIPAILVRRSDKRVIVFYTRHSLGVLRWRISTNPLDISAFGAEKTFNTPGGMTYPQVVQLSAESDRIYVFFRHSVGGDDRNWEFLISNDNGETLGSQTVLRTPISDFTGGVRTPFTIPYSDGVSRIDFVGGNYERVGGGGVPQKIYHFYYEGGDFFKSDGTPTALPLSSDDDMTVVTLDSPVQVWDIVRDGDEIAAVWVRYDDYASSHVYWYGRWDAENEEWDVNPIVDGGLPLTDGDPGRMWVSGGISINRADLNEVYVSISGEYGQATISKWRTGNRGFDWHRVAQYAGDPQRKNFRPVSPHNVDPEAIEVLFSAGAYRDLNAFGPCNVMAWPGPANRRRAPLGFRGALVRLGANQVLAGGGQPIAFDTVTYDTDGFWDGEKFVVPEGVQMIRINLSARFSTLMTQAFINAQVNGSFVPGSAYAWQQGSRVIQAESAEIMVRPGDVITFNVNPFAQAASIEAHGASWASIKVVE